jgi:hypothetical protein
MDFRSCAPLLFYYNRIKGCFGQHHDTQLAHIYYTVFIIKLLAYILHNASIKIYKLL